MESSYLKRLNFFKTNTFPIRHRFPDILLYILGLAMIIGLIIFFHESINYLKVIARVSFHTIIYCLFAHLMGSLTPSVSQIFMAKTFNVHLGFWESYALTIVNRAGNLFTLFRAGTAYRAFYLKRRHFMPLMFFGSMFLGFEFVMILTGSFVGALIVTVLWVNDHQELFALMCLLWSGLIIPVTLLFVPIGNYQEGKKETSRLFLLIKGLKLLRQNRPSLGIAIFGNLLTILSYAIAFKIVLVEMGYYPGWPATILVSTMGGLARLIQLVPGSFGIYEGMIALMVTFFAIPSSVGFSVALLIRICEIGIFATLILPGLWLLNSQKASTNRPLAMQKRD